MKKIILIIFLFFFINLVNALDIELISPCGGDNEFIIGCLGDNELIFIGSNSTISNITVVTSSEISSSYSEEYVFISKELCLITYNFADNNLTNLTKIGNFSKYDVDYYSINWQNICSDILNKSLSEDFLCSEISHYSNYSNLKDNIKKRINISDSLLKFYIKNYESICIKKQPPSITPIDSKTKNYIWIFILILLILFILMIIKRRKIIKYFNERAKTKS